MKLKYVGNYDAVEVSIPGVPKLVERGDVIDVDDTDMAMGLTEGDFVVDGSSPPPPPPPPPSDESDSTPEGA